MNTKPSTVTGKSFWQKKKGGFMVGGIGATTIGEMEGVRISKHLME
ncbi:MAG: hypothetical protein R2784_02440 [Saprospiraceae bacterium]